MNNLVKQVTPANLPDMLRILTAHSSHSRVHRVLSKVLEHDKDCVHLLHPAPEPDSSTGQQGAAAAAGSTCEAKTGTLLRGQQQQQRQQQQQQQHPGTPGVLLKELLGIAVSKGCVHAVHALCKLPCADSVG
jgi:hypothetical protein